MRDLIFRTAQQGDVADLAILADMATRGLMSHLWGLAAAPGQSAFEVGRTALLTQSDHYIFFRNWRIVEVGGAVAGALNCYVIPEANTASTDAPEALRPLDELKALIPGCYYIAMVALYPTAQGQGLGKIVLEEAAASARAAGCSEMALLVGSANTRARNLYQAFGFSGLATRPFVPFPGSDLAGDWILMHKSLS